ncbi:MAG: hypothetical protein HC778_02025 [Chamaesiphon sp. CSU_1_12]|nr:hypothetical protein [Chamaesiphon sp. CSU_1_12]
MTRLLPLQILIKNLKGEIPASQVKIYISKDRAYQLLKEWTGQDFGEDIKAWQAWVKKNPNRIEPVKNKQTEE